MGRIFNFVLLAAMIVGAVVTYDMKHKAEVAADTVARLQAEIAREKDASRAAQGRVEPAHPAGRLQDVVEKYADHFQLQPFSPKQIATIDEIPLKPVAHRPGRRRTGAHRRSTPTPDRAGSNAMTDVPPTIHRQPAGAAPPAPSSRDGMRARIRVTAIVFLLAFLVVVGRLVMFGLTPPATGDVPNDPNAGLATSRPDLVDRNGEILATDIKMASLYAEPRNILDPDEATELITSVLPKLDATVVRKKLASDAGFVWLEREITPAQQKQIHALGIPGIGFLAESRRFYPGGPTAAHIVGLVNVDNQGIAGFEKYVDDHGLADLHAAGFARDEDVEPVRLSIDLRVQHIMRDELAGAMERYHAIAATGIVLNVHTGEVLAMASLPDYDPNNPVDAHEPDRLNRMTAGVYELGSVFKSFTFAMALDSGAVTMNDRIDATPSTSAASPSTTSTPSTAS